MRRTLAALLTATAALLVAAQPIFATTYAEPKVLGYDASDTTRSALATTGSSSAVVAFETAIPENWTTRVSVRRTTDGGRTWTPTTLLSTYGETDDYLAGRPAIAATGMQVALVFQEQYDLIPTHGVRLLTSSNGGSTWTNRGVVSTDAFAGAPSVARAGSRIVVSWTDTDTGAVRVRVSTDSGATFGPAVKVGSTTARPWEDRWDPPAIGTYGYDAEPAVAVSTSAIFATWNADGRILVRRSTDNGRTWSGITTISDTASEAGPSVAATGTQAIVAFVTDTGAASVRRSTDGGRTWKARQALAASVPQAQGILISRTGATWIVAFERCLTSTCATSAVYERRSTNNGGTWQVVSRVSPSYSGFVTPAGAGISGGQLLVIYGRHNTEEYALSARRTR